MRHKTYYADFADVAMNIDAPAAEQFGDNAGRADLFKADFRILMTIMADGGQFAGVSSDALNNGHVRKP
ncbi:hypothetical protein JL39_04015 [Rhizobium sp. YS-1r]|nr:hypothetical protein JL39_04015 [Rhizobium sp. YS-1r]